MNVDTHATFCYCAATMKRTHSDEVPEKAVVAINLRTALLINNAYLPINPNKLRSAHPDVKIAVIDFQTALDRAARQYEKERT